MTNWQKLGYKQEFMDAVARNEEGVLDLWWEGPPAAADEVEGWAASAIPDGYRVFAMGWSGYVFPRPPLDDWWMAGRRSLAAAVYYFQGDWREKFNWCGQDLDRVSSRQSLPWIDQFREGLALATAFDDWESADKILAWPGPDVRFDEGSYDRTREDNAYYIWLAARLRGEAESASDDQRRLASRAQARDADEKRVTNHVLRNSDAEIPFLGMLAKSIAGRELIARGSRRRPKMLIEAADALLAGDKKVFAKALTAYLRHYKQRELDTRLAITAICADATILWHWARRSGMGEIELPEELMMFIPRP